MSQKILYYEVETCFHLTVYIGMLFNTFTLIFLPAPPIVCRVIAELNVQQVTKLYLANDVVAEEALCCLLNANVIICVIKTSSFINNCLVCYS